MIKKLQKLSDRQLELSVGSTVGLILTYLYFCLSDAGVHSGYLGHRGFAALFGIVSPGFFVVGYLRDHSIINPGSDWMFLLAFHIIYCILLAALLLKAIRSFRI